MMESMITIILIHKIIFDIVDAANIPLSESIQSNDNSTKIYIIVAAVVVAFVIGFILCCFYKQCRETQKVGHDSRSVPQKKKGQKIRNLSQSQHKNLGDSTLLMVDTRKPPVHYTTVSSTGSTTPSQIPSQVPPQTPLDPLQDEGIRTDLKQVSRNLKRISSGGLSGPGSRSHSESRETPPPQSRSSSDKSQRVSLDASQILRTTTNEQFDPTRTPEHRSSVYGSPLPQLQSPDISQQQLQQQLQWSQQPQPPTYPEAHDVYPERSTTSFESQLVQASGTRDASPYREYDTQQTFDTPFDPRLQTQSRGSDNSLFDTNLQSSQQSFDDDSGEHFQEPQRSVSPYPPSYNEPSSAPRGRTSYIAAPETDNPGSGSPSPPQQRPLQRTPRGTTRRGRRDNRGR